MSQSAIKAFERRTGLPQDGVMDPHVWNLLQSFATRPVTQTYVVTAEDAAGLAASIPTDYAEKALMPAMAHTSVAERLGERFHMDEKFIEFLNPGVALVPGATIQVMAPNPRLRGQVTRIIIDKDNRPHWRPDSLAGLDPAAIAAHFQPLDKDLDVVEG